MTNSMVRNLHEVAVNSAGQIWEFKSNKAQWHHETVSRHVWVYRTGEEYCIEDQRVVPS
jgi:hypothetical protein